MATITSTVLKIQLLDATGTYSRTLSIQRPKSNLTFAQVQTALAPYLLENTAGEAENARTFTAFILSASSSDTGYRNFVYATQLGDVKIVTTSENYLTASAAARAAKAGITESLDDNPEEG